MARAIPTSHADLGSFQASTEVWQDWRDARNIVSVPVLRDKSPYFKLFCARPTVRILFYTDSASVAFNPAADFGVDRLRDLIRSHNTFYVNFEIDLLNRHAGGHAANKLTPALLAGYQQVWFFGVGQCNLPGEPENELTNAEVAALTNWMSTSGGDGGVLITGDHANGKPPGADAALDPLLNLGRAIGHRVPRAGRLRKWEGPPSAGSDNHNTQEPDGVNNLNNLTLQDDAFPQRLILTRYPLGWWFPRWVRRYRPHPLFCGRNGPIDVFPDHMHEGQLLIPSAYPAAEWPSGASGQPVPEVIARGTDKRNGAVYGIATAYDGGPAGVGRVVADATWHHYFNVNLRGFTAGPVLDDIANFFVNLAVWLSPADKRRQMSCRVWWWVATHPAVLMVARSPIWVLGETAYNVLGKVASQCEILEFIDWPLYEIPRGIPLPWPPEELILGGIMERYHEALDAAAAGKELPDRRELVADGFRRAFAAHGQELSETLEGAESLAKQLDAMFTPTRAKGAGDKGVNGPRNKNKRR